MATLAERIGAAMRHHSLPCPHCGMDLDERDDSRDGALFHANGSPATCPWREEHCSECLRGNRDHAGRGL